MTASFVAESKKVTFDVKYFGLRPQAPSMRDVMGSHAVSGIQMRPAREPAAWLAKQLIASAPIRNLAGLLINGQLQLVL